MAMPPREETEDLMAVLRRAYEMRGRSEALHQVADRLVAGKPLEEWLLGELQALDANAQVLQHRMEQEYEE